MSERASCIYSLMSPDRLGTSLGPSDSLLRSIRNHSTTFLTANQLILPPLSPSHPHLPHPTAEHVNHLQHSLQALHTAKALDTTPLARLRLDNFRARISTRGKTRYGVASARTPYKAKAWRDVEGAFDGSALIALGSSNHFKRDLGLMNGQEYWQSC